MSGEAEAARTEPTPDSTVTQPQTTDKEPVSAAPGAAGPAATATPATVESSASAFDTLASSLPGLLKSTQHSEVWGVQLSADVSSSIPTQIVLQKYLNANDGDVAKAKDQLQKTLEWRHKMQPLELVKHKFNKDKFGGLGFVTVYSGASGAEKTTDPEQLEVFTWNIYGGVKSVDETFGDLHEFIKWRVALMELALAPLFASISTATINPVTPTHDPYKITQVHDYVNISFLRQSPAVKSASTETIRVFAQNYPELLKEKFFLNVPAIMGFVYAFMKLFVAEKTRKKFHPMSNGTALATEFGTSKVAGLGAMLPKAYGGKGADLADEGKSPELERGAEGQSER